MIDMNRLTPNEARAVFDQWIKEESSNYMDKDNARFQIVLSDVDFGRRRVLRGLML